MKTNGHFPRGVLCISALFFLVNRAAGQETSSEITSAQKVGRETWGISGFGVREDKDTGPVVLGIHLYYIQKKQFGASLASSDPGLRPQKREKYHVPGPWGVSREYLPKLVEMLNKFTEWAAVAEKNQVKEVHKQIGRLLFAGSLYFHRGQDAGFTSNWLLVQSGDRVEYKLSAADVSAILELLDKVPALDAQISANKAAVPQRATDALFK